MSAAVKYRILLADDSADDRLFLRRALRRHEEWVIVGEVDNGEDVVSYLSGQAAFADRKKHPFPDLLLVDLKMPRKTGHEVLLWLKSQSFMDDLVVIVISGSSLPEDIAQSLALGADAYHQKTTCKEDQEEMIREIEACLEKRRRHR